MINKEIIKTIPKQDASSDPIMTRDDINIALDRYLSKEIVIDPAFVFLVAIGKIKTINQSYISEDELKEKTGVKTLGARN